MTIIYKVLFAVLLCLCVVYCGGGSGENSGTDKPLYTEYVGVSLLSVRSNSFKCEWLSGALKGIERPALAVLWPSFGTKNDCIEEYIQDEREKVLNVYLHNGVCKKKNNCSSLDSVDIRDQILGGALEANHLVHISQNTKLILTIGLEDEFTDNEACVWYEVLKSALPNVEVWRNPANNRPYNSCFDGIELHNKSASNVQARNSWSNDGYDSPVGGYWRLQFRDTAASLLTQVTERKGNTEIFYIWDATGNGLVNDSASAAFPHIRTIDFNEKDIKDYNEILKGIQNVYKRN